jgi:hypothetical protein
VACFAVAAGLLLALTQCASSTRGDSQPASSPELAAGTRIVRALDPLAPGWGLTHTQHDADDGDGGADASAQQLLAEINLPQDQAVMGWGADNPEPSPGVYDFGSLDSRISVIERSGGLPVITLCCAPDWMKGGPAGQTDWNDLEVAPTPAHYADFAALAATVARRYPQVHDYLVWNEFKGFFDAGDQRWNAADYTDLYNQVYRALKAVNPAIEVGGPYLSMDSSTVASTPYPSALSGVWGTVDDRDLQAFTYWNQHKAGADFVVVDGSSATKDPPMATDEFTATEKFVAVTDWLRQQTGLPVWWSEWYVQPDGTDWTEQHLDAVLAAGLMAQARAGVSASFYWNPETTGTACTGCLWTSTFLGAGKGGLPMPALVLLQDFARWFMPGTRLTAVTDSNPAVYVLAQAGEGLAVNTTDRGATATVDGRALRLTPYQVYWFAK